MCITIKNLDEILLNDVTITVKTFDLEKVAEFTVGDPIDEKLANTQVRFIRPISEDQITVYVGGSL